MSNEKFKVKFGLAVGDTAATIDGTTGDIVTQGDLTVNGGQINGPGGGSDLVIQNASTISVVNDFTRFSTDADVTKVYFNNSGSLFTFNGADTDNPGINLYSNGTIGSLGDATIGGDLRVNGNDIKASDGNIAETFNVISGQSPNTTFTGNVVKGAIRNAPTQAGGNIFTFSASGTGGPTRGLSIDNSVATGQRPGIVLRAYGGGLGAGNPVTYMVTETARGSAATPTGLNSGNAIGAWIASGYADTSVGGANPGWATDTTGNNTAGLTFNTTEAWTSGDSNLGTQLLIRTNPTSSGNAIQNSMTINPQSTISRSDAFTWQNGKSGTTQTMALDVSGNLTVTGDVRINGNDIKASDGSTNITLTSNTKTTVAGSLQINGNQILNSSGNTTLGISSDNSFNNLIGSTTGFTAPSTSPINSNISFAPGDILGATDGDRITQFGLFHYKKTGTTEFPVGSFNNWTYNTSTDLFEPTLDEQTLGQFWFAGNSSSTSSANGLTTARFGAKATEDFTSTAAGTILIFEATATGSINPVEVMGISPDGTSFRSATVSFNDASSTPLLGSQITYNRVYGQWQYDTTITPAVANTAYAFPIASGTTDFANVATVNSTSHIVPKAPGIYKLQFSVQALNTSSGTEHTAYIWWRKNGTDVPASMGRCVVPKGSAGGELIIGWDNMIESANDTDYWELMYAVDNVALTFPAYGTTAFGPSTAALFVTLVPIGA